LRKNIAQNVAQHVFLLNQSIALAVEKIVGKCGVFRQIKKLPKVNDWRKFGQSGHPGARQN
jgi:hypothetical protein